MLVPGPGSCPGITVALAGPWGRPFALSLPLLVGHVAKMQPCLRGGLGEIGMRDVLSSAPPFLGEPHWTTGLWGSRASLRTPPHLQVPLDERIIFSGNLFQYQEDNKKWRNRFSLVPHNYGLVLYENKVVSPPPPPPTAPLLCSFSTAHMPSLLVLLASSRQPSAGAPLSLCLPLEETRH